MTKGKNPRPPYLRALSPPAPAAVAEAAKEPVGQSAATPAAMDVPDWLPEKEQKVWHELISQAPAPALENLNRLLFEALVRATVQYREAARRVSDVGAVVKSPSGYPIQSPFVSVMNKQAEMIRHLSADLGLSSLSRARAKGKPTKPQPRGNPFEGLKSL